MDVKLPKLGEGADSGSVVGILVKVGDQVQAGQNVIELENEKAIAPIPTPQSGVVTQIYVKEGQKLSVGQRILSLTPTGEAPTAPSKSAAPVEAPSKPAPARAKAAPATPVQTVTVAPEPVQVFEVGEVVNPNPAASPSIRKMARELGLDLTRIRGSERGGRIVMADIKAYIQRLLQLAAAPKVQPAAAPEPVPTAPPPVQIDFAAFGPVTRKPLTSLRATISRRMHESWSAIPHVTQFDEADITALMELRKKYNPAYEAREARLTLTPFTLKATVAALKQSPIFNASLDEVAREIVFKDYYHIGMAVDTEAGLIVPVIRDVDKKSLLQLSKELQDIATKTRSRKIGAEDLKGGTFTISNQGGIGGAHFTPIINRPEVAILGLGRSVQKPVVRNNKIEIRTMMPVCVSYDHRLIDGGNAARFITQIVQALENFNEADVKLGK